MGLEEQTDFRVCPYETCALFSQQLEAPGACATLEPEMKIQSIKAAIVVALQEGVLQTRPAGDFWAVCLPVPDSHHVIIAHCCGELCILFVQGTVNSEGVEWRVRERDSLPGLC